MRNDNLSPDPAWYNLVKWYIPTLVGSGVSILTYLVLAGRFIAQTLPILAWPSLVNTIPTIVSLSGFLGTLAKIGFVVGSGSFAFAVAVLILHPVTGMVDMRIKNTMRAINAQLYQNTDDDKEKAKVRMRFDKERADPMWYNFAKWGMPIGTGLTAGSFMTLLLFARVGVTVVPALGWIAALVMSLEGAASFLGVTAVIGSTAVFAGYVVACVTHTFAGYSDCQIKKMLRDDYDRFALDAPTAKTGLEGDYAPAPQYMPGFKIQYPMTNPYEINSVQGRRNLPKLT